MKCPFCGHELSVSAKICYNCGHEFYSGPKGDIEGGGCMDAITVIIGAILGLLLMMLLFWPTFEHIWFKN